MAFLWKLRSLTRRTMKEDDDEVGTYPDSYMRDGGPPWKEDSDLASPVVISHSVGDRISKEYEFSVASADEIHGRAVALFDFIPENENEAPLKEGQVIWVSYRHGQGWLVAEDPRTGETGLVPRNTCKWSQAMSIWAHRRRIWTDTT